MSDLGLIVLEASIPPMVESNGRPRVDIVMVHGLDGNRLRTWTKDNIFWPRDLLPRKISNARIMTFGYNANLAKNYSTLSIRDHATKLLASLRDKREEPDELQRPLIFVCHSLGGIVVKQALLISSIDQNYRSLAGSTKGIVFFGTPHRGADLASWGSILATIAKVAFLNPKKQFLDDLKKNSKALSDISEDFVKIVAKYSIKSFYESDKVGGITVVVKKDSAVIGVTQEEAASIDGNHMDICRFTGVDDERFEAVWKAIRRLMPNPETLGLTKDQWEILNTFPGPKVNTCIIGVEEPFPGTFTWLSSHRSFIEWLTSTESHILHILGQPGSGKSVLAAFLYQFRIWSAPDQVVFYFAFHDQKDRQSAFFAWSSLVSQLLIEDPSLFSTLIPNHRIERRRAQYGDGNSWSEPQLRQTFEQLALGCQYPSVYIIDALDQCDTSLERFLGSFSNLIKRTAGPPIKVLVLSKYQSPAALPTQFLRALTIDLDSEIEHQNDIDKFIKEKVDELCEQRGLGVFGDLIRERLSQNASGMYLLPYLAIKTLKSVRSTRREIITALTSLPESLASAYRQTLDAVHPDDRVVTGTILRWVVFGIRPLTVEELSTAAAVKSSVTDISEVSDETSVDVMGDRGVVELVGSILKVTKDRLVSLVHQSARIFLLKTELNSASPPSWLLEIFYGSDHIPAIMQVESLSSHAHEGLAKNCACYIELVRQKLRIINAGGFAEQTYQRESSNTFDEANVDSCDAEKFPLLEYAVEALSEHVREVDSSKSDFHVYFASYLASEAGKLWIEKFWSLRDPGQRHIVQPPLHIACLLGLLPTIRSRLELGDDPNIRDSFGKNTAIAVAASTGSVEMMRILCEAGAHVNAPQTGNWTALHTAVFYGHKEVVKFLLDESAELDAMEDELKRYPMDLAVEAGNHAILQVLLLRGGLLKTSERIFPGSFKSLEWNALHSAARCGRVDTLKWLLANGYGSLTDQDFKQKTPLHIATEAEQIDCVRCLLDEGSCDNIHDSDGNYALHLAAGKGLDDIILLLLDHKVVDINAVDKFGRNAFFHASTTRQIRTMAILLERGIDVDIEDENGDTVLKLLITKWGRPFGADERPIPLIDAETLKYVWEVSNKRPCQKNGDNLLHISTRHFPRSIGLFLDLGLDPYETNIDGQTPLHIATLERNRRGFELFLGLYDNIDQQDSTGQTALHILLKSYGGKDLGQRLDLLIAKGVNIHLQDNYNRTGFDYYCADVCAYNRSRYRRAYWSDRIISRLLSHNAEFSDEFKTRKEDLLINLIKAGLPEDTKQVLHTTGAMDLEELKKRGVEDKIVIFIWLMGHPEDTLLRFIERLDLEWLELLFGVELCEHRSTSGVACAQCSDSITLHTLTTPAVLSAAEKGDLALLEYLVGKCSADPNIPHRPSLRTALSYAAENGHIAAAKYLVSKKAKLEAVDADGRTALWWATKEERTEMVKFLSEAERT